MNQSRPEYLDQCIYTIRQRAALESLERSASSSGSGSFEEHSRWVTGKRLLDEAKCSGKHLAILFAPADEEAGVCWYATLTKIDFAGQGAGRETTLYHFQGLSRLPEELPLDTLVKSSDGRPLSRKYIRPYAICKTPPVLHEARRL